jgi:hypothetical protein
MLRNRSVKIPSAFRAIGFLLAAIALSLSVQSAAAASGKYQRATPTMHRPHHLYATYHRAYFAHPQPLPYGPEYGFFRYVPANAIRMPGYTFVPGVGILGESCDMPTSACTNEYRDVK